MIYLIPLPFLIELFGDWILIGKGRKDIPLWARAVMIVAVSLESLALSTTAFNNHDIALACAPFCFFDNVLAWLRGKRGLDYEGKTKAWDKFLARFNPRFLVIVRGIICASLITFGLWHG